MSLIMNNVVNKTKLREIQSGVLQELSDILKNSFGPYGSNACIKKENAFSRYSKDGHTIIGSLHYNGIIEQSIKDDIESITRHIVKTVGDGTTSAVILSNLIFERIKDFEKNYKPVEIIKTLETISEMMETEISKHSKDITIDDIYDIAMISTNGNTFISETIRDIYKEFGYSVFIDVSPSVGEELVIKSYDGMTLSTGYCDSSYVTNKKNNTAEVDHPEVYFFEHPVDTKEIGVLFDAILSHNIVEPANNGTYEKMVPTVIFAPKISQDMSSIMDSLTAAMAQMPAGNKFPICIISDYVDIEPLTDLSQMCGAKLIRKYIDPKIYENDVKRGAAPTPDTINKWAGKCEKIVAYSDKTTFVKPAMMYTEDGSHTEFYNNLVDFLEVELAKAIENGDDPRTIGKIKRRLHSVKCNFVELFVGGITQADRDSLRDLVEDAVLNIRSAAMNGVGLGANMTATISIDNICGTLSPFNNSTEELLNNLAFAIKDAYDALAKELYSNKDITVEEMILRARNGVVYNLRTDEWSTNVKTSIKADTIIFDTVCKIVSIMATCNQFITPTAMHNIYTDSKWAGGGGANSAIDK